MRAPNPALPDADANAARRSSCSRCTPRACRTTASSTSRIAAASACRCSRIDGKYVHAGVHRPRVQGAGLRQRHDRREHGVLDRPGAALPVRRQPQPGQGHGVRSQDAAAARLVRAVGLGARRVRHAASHGGRLEGQPLRHRGHAAQAREPARSRSSSSWGCRQPLRSDGRSHEDNHLLSAVRRIPFERRPFDESDRLRIQRHRSRESPSPRRRRL